MPRLKKALRVPTPADRVPGRPWRPGNPPPAPIDPDLPSADIRIGYARCSILGQELDSQLDALAKHGIPRDKIFSEKISTRVRVRPKFEEALRTAREVKAHADHLTAHGLVLEMLAGPLPGIYDPTGPGKLLFAFFAALAETERENIRESTLEGLDTAARKGKHGGRPPVITDDMLHTVLRRRASGESVEQIQRDLIIPTGKRKGQNPSVASIYRALAEHAKREAYPEAVEQAHADFAVASGEQGLHTDGARKGSQAEKVWRYSVGEVPRMRWKCRRRFAPVPSPTRSATCSTLRSVRSSSSRARSTRARSTHCIGV
ncbi:DNA invertase Pin-like site-specific DNA recombinase [Streptomyces iranensis]|uniref:DNA invertase Pin-like site-specific DNA recombinase n=1 Tax=Streptomyces iranensis TaxID=576784 RepID=A0ABS4N622_9ACTN|nr:DNA invertase Pin-like site-specific DNA recombinase [Streptomyces iranensis]